MSQYVNQSIRLYCSTLAKWKHELILPMGMREVEYDVSLQSQACIREPGPIWLGPAHATPASLVAWFAPARPQGDGDCCADYTRSEPAHVHFHRLHSRHCTERD